MKRASSLLLTGLLPTVGCISFQDITDGFDAALTTLDTWSQEMNKATAAYRDTWNEDEHINPVIPPWETGGSPGALADAKDEVPVLTAMPPPWCE